MADKVAEKVKVTVNLLKDDFESLQKTAARNGTTFTEEMRKALSLARLADQTESAGGKVLLEQKNGELRQIVKV